MKFLYKQKSRRTSTRVHTAMQITRSQLGLHTQPKALEQQQTILLLNILIGTE